MEVREWPEGTKKTVVVEMVLKKRAALVYEPSTKEGFVLLGIDLEDVEEGSEREIVLLAGGPTGGFWDFVR